MILRVCRRQGFQLMEASKIPEDLVTGTNSWAPIAENFVQSTWDEARESATLLARTGHSWGVRCLESPL